MSHPNEIFEFFLNAPKNVKLLLDVGHLKVSSKTEGFSKIMAIKKLNRFISCYHLSDNDSNSDNNKPFTKNSWFLNYLKKNLDYYTVEVYSNSTKILKNQIKIVNNHI